MVLVNYCDNNCPLLRLSTIPSLRVCAQPWSRIIPCEESNTTKQERGGDHVFRVYDVIPGKILLYVSEPTVGTQVDGNLLLVTLTQLTPAQPNPTQPNPTQPNPTQPNPTQPNPTQPNPTQPNPAQPNPAQPNPSVCVQLPVAVTAMSCQASITALKCPPRTIRG